MISISIPGFKPRAQKAALHLNLAAGVLSLLMLGTFVTSSASAQDLKLGRARAQAACATCHGPNGLSTMPNAANLAGQPSIYLEEQLKAYRSGKRHHEVMSVIAKTLSDEDILHLSAWYAAIKVSADLPQ